MSVSIQKLLRGIFQRKSHAAETEAFHSSPPANNPRTIGLDIAPDDPFLIHVLHNPGVVDVDSLDINSPIVEELRASGVRLAVPLVSQGELIGLLNLGARLSEQEYSQDDRQLLNSLAIQATPALRVAQLARQRQEEAQERERMEQEMRVARIIQQTLLPKQLPSVRGFELAVHWQPARAVGGDFYDFFEFPDGKLGLVVGDVTDKGVPAALVMASTRSVLRTTAERLVSPSRVLTEANNLMCPDMPNRMFVTCLYAVLDPISGHLRFANAGHNLPYRRSGSEVSELHATGMPLGLLPDMEYDEKEIYLAPGDCIIFYSDGLVEAHNRTGDMFGFPRLRQLLAEAPCSTDLIQFLLDQLEEFTGSGWDQEDDVTFVTLENTLTEFTPPTSPKSSSFIKSLTGWHTLAEFELPSEPGNERIAMNRVAELIEPVELPGSQVERLKTAVAEATMNAMEHGNHYMPEVPVRIKVRVSPLALSVQITDFGGAETIPDPPESPDLEAKLAGKQSPRGWGLFLIENMVDGMVVTTENDQHTIDLILLLEGDEDA